MATALVIPPVRRVIAPRARPEDGGRMMARKSIDREKPSAIKPTRRRDAEG
jgi:hypothetical protein